MSRSEGASCMSRPCRSTEMGIHRRMLENDSGPRNIANTNLKSRCFPMHLCNRLFLGSGEAEVEKWTAALVVALVAVEPTDARIFRFV